jgi:anti-sigma regulatory factor (Ser/Thr protein kinase)
LSQTLAASMTDDSRPISLEVQADGGTVSSAEALSVGLIVSELMINAFKHAFVGDAAAGVLVIAYEAAETSWRLAVSDNGIGMPGNQLATDKPRPGLGTIIVAALAKQLDARVEVMGSRRGTTVSITHGTPDGAWLPLEGAKTGLPLKSNGTRRPEEDLWQNPDSMTSKPPRCAYPDAWPLLTSQRGASQA